MLLPRTKLLSDAATELAASASVRMAGRECSTDRTLRRRCQTEQSGSCHCCRCRRRRRRCRRRHSNLERTTKPHSLCSASGSTAIKRRHEIYYKYLDLRSLVIGRSVGRSVGRPFAWLVGWSAGWPMGQSATLSHDDGFDKFLKASSRNQNQMIPLKQLFQEMLLIRCSRR